MITIMDISNFRTVHLQKNFIIQINAVFQTNRVHTPLDQLYLYNIKLIWIREATDSLPPYMNFWIHYLSIMPKAREQIKSLGFYWSTRHKVTTFYKNQAWKFFTEIKHLKTAWLTMRKDNKIRIKNKTGLSGKAVQITLGGFPHNILNQVWCSQ